MKKQAMILVAVAAAVLQACTSPQAEWSPVEAPRDIQVDYARTAHTAHYAPGASELSPVERARLSEFLRTSEARPHDSIYLEPAAGDHLSVARVNALARELLHRGYEVSPLPPSRDAVRPNSLLVVVERYVATPPNCPNFSKSSSDDHENALPSNWGCANQTNLSLMVANPRDLVIGRDPSLEPADAAVLPIQRYRLGKTAPLPSENAGEAYTPPASATGGSSAAPTQGAGQ